MIRHVVMVRLIAGDQRYGIQRAKNASGAFSSLRSPRAAAVRDGNVAARRRSSGIRCARGIGGRVRRGFSSAAWARCQGTLCRLVGIARARAIYRHRFLPIGHESDPRLRFPAWCNEVTTSRSSSSDVVNSRDCARSGAIGKFDERIEFAKSSYSW